MYTNYSFFNLICESAYSKNLPSARVVEIIRDKAERNYLKKPRMIGRCRPSVTKLYESYEICENRVTFVNVKSKYFIDEDLTVNYSLNHKEFKSSTRDWIGIFPRYWSNLQQYLTFEYTLSSPPNAKNPHNRQIIFPRLFHREASINLEYHFVYVSKEIQIMAISSYFRFAPIILNNEIQRCPSISNNVCLSIESSYNTNIENNNVANIDDSFCNDGRLLSTKQEENSTSLAISGQKNLVNGVRQKCQYCHRQICGLKIDALRGDFLAAFSDSLLDRVRRLERDLSLAESNLKNAKDARENIAKRLRAYEAFVTEMLSSVDARGIVQITDEKGNEILLQRVNENDDSTIENTRANDSLEKEIIALKSLVEMQQQTIGSLIAEQNKNVNIPRRERIKLIDRSTQTISDPSQAESVLSDKLRDIDEKKLDDLDEKVSPKSAEPKNDENFNLTSINLPTKDEMIGSAKCPTEGKNISSKCSTEHRVLKIPKPSGILVQGKNIKFAIVRSDMEKKNVKVVTIYIEL